MKLWELKSHKMLCLVLGATVLISSCSQKEINPYSICKEFYQLNKSKDFDGLFDVSIGVDRVRSVYNDSLKKYDLIFNTIEVFDSVSQNYIMLPVYKRGASLAKKDSLFKKIRPEVKKFLTSKLAVTSSSMLFDSYVKYVDKLFQKYYSISTPESNSHTNVVLEGHPPIGRFITFPLDEGVNIYYVGDTNSLTAYWTKYFSELNKFDDNWFYEIKNTKASE